MGQPAYSLYLCLMAGPVSRSTIVFPYLCELHVLLRQDLAVGVWPDFLQLWLLLPCEEKIGRSPELTISVLSPSNM